MLFRSSFVFFTSFPFSSLMLNEPKLDTDPGLGIDFKEEFATSVAVFSDNAVVVVVAVGTALAAMTLFAINCGLTDLDLVDLVGERDLDLDNDDVCGSDRE